MAKACRGIPRRPHAGNLIAMKASTSAGGTGLVELLRRW